MKVAGAKPPEPGHAVRVSAEGVTVAVFNVGGQLSGIDAKCTHVGGPLEQGKVAGTTVTCPWHGSQFDVGTGALVRGPAMKPVRAYQVRAEPDGLVVEPK